MASHGHAGKQPDGRYESITYTSWRNMIQRCTNPNSDRYEDYGAKGIAVCERWRKFANFLEDMGERPSVGHTLGRIAPFADYGPGEVEWQTRPEQNALLNDESGIVVTVDGLKMTRSQWADHLGIKYKTLCKRLQRGWGDDAYRVPFGSKRAMLR